jgi:hypothetical protein
MSDPPEEDDIIAFLKAGGVPVTRAAYLEVYFMGEVPEEISWEHELEFPEFLGRSIPGGSADVLGSPGYAAGDEGDAQDRRRAGSCAARQPSTKKHPVLLT